MKEINSPKRRKSKDNPYIINHIENNNTYIIIFKSNNKEKKVQVSKEVYDAFNQFELEDLKQLNEKDRHYERLEQSDEFIYKRSFEEHKSLEEQVEEKILNEEIKLAINNLTEIQKRRLKLYYFDNYTLEKIAKIEGCSIISVKESIDSALVKLKKIIKK